MIAVKSERSGSDRVESVRRKTDRYRSKQSVQIGVEIDGIESKRNGAGQVRNATIRIVTERVGRVRSGEKRIGSDRVGAEKRERIGKKADRSGKGWNGIGRIESQRNATIQTKGWKRNRLEKVGAEKTERNRPEGFGAERIGAEKKGTQRIGKSRSGENGTDRRELKRNRKVGRGTDRSGKEKFGTDRVGTKRSGENGIRIGRNETYWCGKDRKEKWIKTKRRKMERNASKGNGSEGKGLQRNVILGISGLGNLVIPGPGPDKIQLPVDYW